ncbi:coiled-coil protein [Legionella beliardensis]|uniref:Coiled-coil protein n=1 Tax=Legionella beliardensis TaxID=91822 RepID=A0A378JTL1_9GAMM|nr:zeta toxin family protein [Legionella beliardensis]STX55609.1 coiled-coil protein [Legionella beliardensis]
MQSKFIPQWSIFSPKQSLGSHTQNLFFKRFHSTQLSRAWDNTKSPYQVDDILQGKVKLTQGTHFSIINPAYINRSLDEIKKLYAAMGTSNHHNYPYRRPRDLVVFNPSRTAWQQTGLVVATEIKVEDDAHYVDICNKLKKDVEYRISAENRSYQIKEKEIEASVYDAIRNCKLHSIALNKTSEHYLHLFQAIHSRQPTWPLKEIEAAAAKITIDDLLRESIRSQAYDHVIDIVSEQIEHQRLAPLEIIPEQDRQQIMLLLPQFSANQRLMQVMAGGPASGKSVTTKQFMAHIKQEYGLSLSDFSFISTDRFRLLLLNDESLGKDIVLRGLHTQDEARLMTEQAIQIIGKKVGLIKYAPNVFMETVNPVEEEILIGTSLGSKLRISVTAYPPEKAVEGNYKRYQERHERLPPVAAVLGGQKLVSSEAPKMLSKYQGKDIVMTLYNTYALIHDQNEKNAFIGAFHCREDLIILRDINEVLNFVKKSHLNPYAEGPESMYLNSEKLNNSALIAEFFAQYKDKEIIFVDPKANDVDYDNLTKNTYATFSPDSGLIIKNEAIFKRENQNPIIKEFFAFADNEVKLNIGHNKNF